MVARIETHKELAGLGGGCLVGGNRYSFGFHYVNRERQLGSTRTPKMADFAEALSYAAVDLLVCRFVSVDVTSFEPIVRPSSNFNTLREQQMRLSLRFEIEPIQHGILGYFKFGLL